MVKHISKNLGTPKYIIALNKMKENLNTLHISEFTADQTIYIVDKEEFNKPLMLCQFVSYDSKTNKVTGTILQGTSRDGHRFRVPVGKILVSSLSKCALYGFSKDTISTKHYHWFDANGYALNPLEEEKEDTNSHHVEEHESYGIIRGCRRQKSVGGTLFGTSTNHMHTISISISTATHKRDLNNDWIHAKEQLIEIEISENQFAQFITNMNTEGVPCTIRHLNREKVADPPYISKEELFQKEFESKMKNLAIDLRKATETSTAILGKTNITKADRELLLKDIGNIINKVSTNIPFIREQFQEQLSDMINAAKIEMEAFAEQLIRQKGLEALGASNENFRNILNKA